MSRVKRMALILVIVMVSVLPCFADSLSLNTSINSISYGISDFGWGLFPIGTNFDYNKGFHPFKSLTNGATFYVGLLFEASTRWDNSGSPYISQYDYKTGKPYWSDGPTENTINAGYSRIVSQLETYLQQGFGINPVQGSGALVNLRLTWVSRFANSAESLQLVDKGPDDAIFNKPPFSTNEELVAYPWLEGGRQLWNNHLAFSSYWYFRESTTRTDNYDGAYMTTVFEYGPWWLGNNLFPDNVTSDFFRAYWSLEEKLTVFSIEQDNGWNWFNLELGHSNSISYTWGDVIPEHKINRDRLRGILSDAVYLKVTGPQFIATDCYPYIQLTINNNLYFGGVQNEITGKIRGIELRSSFDAEFHLRLFGFLHFRYRFHYYFINGFSTSAPNWKQDAEIGFYVSL